MRMMVVTCVVCLGACTAVTPGRGMDSLGSGLTADSTDDPTDASGETGSPTDADSDSTDDDPTSADTDTDSDSDSDSDSDTDSDTDTGTAPLDCPTLGAWHSSAPFADGDGYSHPLPSFAAEGHYYVHAIIGGQRILYSASPAPDGSLGDWQVASEDHGGGPHGFTAVVANDTAYHFRNGHIAEYPLDQGIMHGDVLLLEDDPDQAFGGEKFVWDSATLVSFGDGSQWVFHLGGFSFAPYAYRPAVRRNAVPLGPVFDEVGHDHPADRPGKAAAYVPTDGDHGWIISGEAGGSRLWQASVQSDGSLGGWSELPELPAGTGNERGDLWVAGQALFVVRGSSVFRTLMTDDGATGPWSAMPSLPEDQIDVHWGDGHGEGAAWGRIGDTIYLTGPRAVFHAELEPGDCDP